MATANKPWPWVGVHTVSATSLTAQNFGRGEIVLIIFRLDDVE